MSVELYDQWFSVWRFYGTCSTLMSVTVVFKNFNRSELQPKFVARFCQILQWFTSNFFSIAQNYLLVLTYLLILNLFFFATFFFRYNFPLYFRFLNWVALRTSLTLPELRLTSCRISNISILLIHLLAHLLCFLFSFLYRPSCQTETVLF